MGRLRILTFSTLFPNQEQPHHGVFVARRLEQLLLAGAVESRVVAPVPWFPWSHRWFGGYGRLARVPRRERRGEVAVSHPRYPVIPKVGMTLAPLLLALWSLPHLRRLAREWDFQLIDAHYFYPDGVAAVLLGRWLGKPVVVTARGTDLNLIPRYRLPRWMIQWAAARAAGLVTVCAALKESLVDLGVPPRRVTVLRNGVDLERFQPEGPGWPAGAGKEEPPGEGGQHPPLGRHRGGPPLLLSVGHLIPRKGHDLVIRALAELPGVTLWIVGEGPERGALAQLAERSGVAGRVHFAGAVAPEGMPALYRQADALVLASSREGWANVLLESMACGTPVVATPVWGTPEVVNSPAAGVLAGERSVAALVAGCRALLDHPPSRAAVRRHAEQFSWEATSAGQLALFRQIVGEGR